MLTRVWFSLSVLWAIAVCSLCGWNQPGLNVLDAAFPLLAGVFLKRLWFYWCTGRLR
jgi:hypothetical protein